MHDLPRHNARLFRVVPALSGPGYQSPTGAPLNVILFVSHVVEADVNAALTPAKQLAQNGQLTIVALGNLQDSDIALLQKLTSKTVIQWKDLTQPSPPNWQQQFQAAYGCG